MLLQPAAFFLSLNSMWKDENDDHNVDVDDDFQDQFYHHL